MAFSDWFRIKRQTEAKDGREDSAPPAGAVGTQTAAAEALNAPAQPKDRETLIASLVACGPEGPAGLRRREEAAAEIRSALRLLDVRSRAGEPAGPMTGGHFPVEAEALRSAWQLLRQAADTDGYDLGWIPGPLYLPDLTPEEADLFPKIYRLGEARQALVLGTSPAAGRIAEALKRSGVRTVLSGSIPDTPLRSVTLLVRVDESGDAPRGRSIGAGRKDFPFLREAIDLTALPYRGAFLTEMGQKKVTTDSGMPFLAALTLLRAGLPAEEGNLRTLVRLAEQELPNLVLIGMPGSGKSTQAQILGRLLDRPVYDTDLAVQYRVRESIPEFIRKYGEAAFREEEAAAVRELSRLSGIILATGGGTVLRPENRAALRENGRVIYLVRELSRLSTHGRPLSAGPDALRKLSAQRIPLYNAAADEKVYVTDNKRETAQLIIDAWSGHGE
ncbi:MAG: hypothetical protein ILP12_00635 [Lachnospiraceae bacterium]|nr:hypothetical protein [Lachnospiraceae bacterium]